MGDEARGLGVVDDNNVGSANFVFEEGGIFGAPRFEEQLFFGK